MTGPEQGNGQNQPNYWSQHGQQPEQQGQPSVDFSKPDQGQAPGQQPYPSHGQQAYGQPPYGQQYAQQPYGQQYGQPPYGAQPYGGQPYGYGVPPNPYGMPTAAVSKPIGWFIVNWLFFWPLAIYSLVSAWQNIDPALFAGDVAGAQRQADRVKKYGVIALCVGIALFVLGIILNVVVFATITRCAGRYSC